MIALAIIIGIILLVVLVLCIPVTVELDYNETFKMNIKYLFLDFQIFPEKEKPEKKKHNKPEKKKDEQPQHKVQSDKKIKPKKDNMFLVFYHNQGFEGVINLIKDVMGVLGDFTKSIFVKHFIIKEMYIDMIVGGPDSAETAIRYGKVSSVVFPAMGYICSKMKVRKYDVDITPDFLATKDEALFYVALKLTPICMTNAVVVLAFRLLIRLLKVIFTNSKAENERKTTVNKTIKKAKEKNV